MTDRLRGRKGVERRRLFLMENPLCVQCTEAGRATVATEVDHIVPLARGGEDCWENLQSLCTNHHRIKTAKDFGKRATFGFDADGNSLDPDSQWKG